MPTASANHLESLLRENLGCEEYKLKKKKKARSKYFFMKHFLMKKKKKPQPAMP